MQYLGHWTQRCVRAARWESSLCYPGGPVALTENGELSRYRAQLDGEGEFGEGRRQPIFRVGVRAEFVVAAAHVLNKSVSGANHSSRTKLFEAAHRPQSSLESPMMCFDTIIAVLLSEMA